MTMVIITGGIDLSVGSVLALSKGCDRSWRSRRDADDAGETGIVTGAACGADQWADVTKMRSRPLWRPLY
jgi:ribose/xylose/arabinose/galactoside ABC-type transport system permease subunit